MIREIEENGAWQRILEGDDVLHGCLLTTEWRIARRYPMLDSRFWVLYDDSDRPAAVLNGRPGGLFLLCGAPPDTDELRLFLSYNSCRTLLGDAGNINATDSAPVMRCWGGAPDPRVVRMREGLRAVHALAEQSLAPACGYDEWLSGVRLREGDGFCAVYALIEDETLIAAAMFTGAREHDAVIGGVAVHPKWRGRGYGGAIVRHLAEAAAQSSRRAVVACADESLAGFYRSLGFKPCGRWACADWGGEKENDQYGQPIFYI